MHHNWIRSFSWLNTSQLTSYIFHLQMGFNASIMTSLIYTPHYIENGGWVLVWMWCLAVCCRSNSVTWCGKPAIELLGKLLLFRARGSWKAKRVPEKLKSTLRASFFLFRLKKRQVSSLTWLECIFSLIFSETFLLQLLAFLLDVNCL